MLKVLQVRIQEHSNYRKENSISEEFNDRKSDSTNRKSQT